MFIIQVILTVILLPVALHLLRILVFASPGHSRTVSPVVNGMSGMAIVFLIAVLAGILASGRFEPLDLPQRPDLQRDVTSLERSFETD